MTVAPWPHGPALIPSEPIATPPTNPNSKPCFREAFFMEQASWPDPQLPPFVF